MKYLAVLGCLSLLIAACDGRPAPAPQPSPVSPAPEPAPAPLPPPTPLANLTGTWVGTVEFNSTAQGVCPVREDVRVTLYHRENNLVFGGTTNQTRCWGVVFLRGKLQGTLEGTGLSVELWTSSDEKLTTLNGIASSAKLSVARQTQNEGYPVALAVTR